jgi:FkbM family methyltransferase
MDKPTSRTAFEFVSYSANAEDVLLRRLFPGPVAGFYVDVGAAHPIWESDTKALWDRGWRGINIEPQEEFLAELRRYRPDDVSLGVALSDAPGELTFFEVEGTGLSTLDKHNAARAEAKGYLVRPRRVPILTLAQVLAENNVPSTFEFLKIDVEGLEQSVLAGNDWQRFRPQVVMIEATVPETPIRRQDGCRDLLTGMGWRHAWFDGLNDWYLAPNFEPPNGAFDAPPNIFDHYVTRRTVEAETQLAEWRQATEVRDGRIRELETVAAAQAGVVSLLTNTIAESVRGGKAEVDITTILEHLRESLANTGDRGAADDVWETTAVPLLDADNARLRANLAELDTDFNKHRKALSQAQHDLIAARQEVADARAASNHLRELLNQTNAQSAVALAEARAQSAVALAEVRAQSAVALAEVRTQSAAALAGQQAQAAAALAGQQAQAAAALARQQAQAAAALAEVRALRTSTSWRVSAPVRALRRMLPRRRAASSRV